MTYSDDRPDMEITHPDRRFQVQMTLMKGRGEAKCANKSVCVRE